MNPAYTFTDDDKASPVYCMGCRQHIPRVIANALNGYCPSCHASVTKASAPPVPDGPNIPAYVPPPKPAFIPPPHVPRASAMPPTKARSGGVEWNNPLVILGSIALVFVIGSMAMSASSHPDEPKPAPAVSHEDSTSSPATTPPVEEDEQSRPYKVGDADVAGYKPYEASMSEAGLTVYSIGWRVKGESAKIKKLFTIHDVGADGGMMTVTYPSGETEVKEPQALAENGLGTLWVKE